MNSVFYVKNLRCQYGANEVIKDLSFSVPKGCFFIIIGPNGSGKTTLLKTLAGIEKPNHGQIHLLNRPLNQYSRKKLARVIAFVPQVFPVDFPFTVKETVLMGRSPYLGILGLEHTDDAEIVQQSMCFTGIEKLADRRLNQLSGGERQRVYISRAICQEPEIIILDEPTASLDLAHQVRVMDLMEKLQSEKGLTVVMVSHDLNLAAIYAEKLLLMKDGNIVEQGVPDKVLTFQTLESVYNCKLLVDKSPLGKFPRITLVPQRILDPDLNVDGPVS